MAKKQPSDVAVWLGRETPRIRKALENASRYFNGSDRLTVNTLEAIYSQESSFGTLMGTRGSTDPAGHFQFGPATAEQSEANQTRQYVEQVPLLEAEFAQKSSADKSVKDENPRTGRYDCTEGHWVTIDDHPVFICA